MANSAKAVNGYTELDGVTDGDTADFRGGMHHCALTSVETAEVYIGVCPVDINTGCKTAKGRG